MHHKELLRQIIDSVLANSMRLYPAKTKTESVLNENDKAIPLIRNFTLTLDGEFILQKAFKILEHKIGISITSPSHESILRVKQLTNDVLPLRRDDGRR